MSNPVPTAAVLLSQSPANHSPRVYAHCTALLQSSTVDIVILIANPPQPSNLPSNILFIPLYPSPPNPHRTLSSLFSKALHNVSQLFKALRILSSFNLQIRHVILTTPPAIPTMPFVALIKLFYTKCTYTIDWHNFAFSIMQTTASPPLLVRVARFIELISARCFTNHWVVSNAMAKFLVDTCALQATVIYDRPRPEFRRALADKDHHSVSVLSRARELATCIGADMRPEEDRSLPIIITSTSWTPDEDFEMLFKAILQWEEKKRSMVVVITGKGPLREQFENRMGDAHLQYVAVWFAWMAIEDYPHLLAACHLGVSLHASSSGLDLPMKAVDMLGSGLPVVALRYECIDELIIDNVTGVLFDDEEGLQKAVDYLLFQDEGVRAAEKMREKIRDSFAKEDMLWQASWERDALPTLKQAGAALGWSPS